MTLTLLWLVACTDGNNPQGKDTDTGTTDSGTTDTGPADADADGYDETVDCNDADANIHPDAQELCDAADVDEDCDGLADDADDSATGQTSWYVDADLDTYGDAATAELHCDSTTLIAVADDCDDQDAAINPGAAEVCDDAGVDEDCDGDVNDDDDNVTGTITVYVDIDADGYGDETKPAEVCEIGIGQVLVGGDCNDGNYLANPGATEVCDAYDVDEDCDGLSEDADDSVTGTTAAYTDADGDTYGDPATEVARCDTTGLVLVGDDCDDTDAAVNPAVVWYPDTDADGYGDLATAFTACEPPADAVSDSTDCDDSRADVHPGSVEVCDDDNVDEDCNGVADDEDEYTDYTTMSEYYRDEDKDGYGDGSNVAQGCERPTGYIDDASDCNDGFNIVHPGAAEICNDGMDDNCDVTDDETCQQTGDVRLNAANTDAVLSGAYADGQFGLFLGGYGDLTGDGDDDLLVGARQWSEAEAGGGAAFLFAGPISDGNTTGATTTFLGTDPDDSLGNSLAAGDFDGDGTMDVIVPAGSASGDAGASTGWIGLWFGPLDATEDRTTADMSWEGTTTDDYAGWGLGAADVSGDGATDLFWTTSDTAGLYVVNGPITRGVTPAAELWATADGVNDSPSALASGDINGDGIDEIALSAYARSSLDEGVVWVVDSSLGGADLDTDAPTRLSGDDRNDYFGISIDVGDGNNDGYADLMVAAVGVDDAFTNAGAVYIYNGPLAGELATSDATVSILGTAPNLYVGSSVAWVGDFDRDGVGDFAIGVPKDDTVKTDGGMTALFYGAVYGSFTTDDANYRVLGTGNVDESGDFVAAGGDLNSDNTDDMVVGAPLDDDAATDGGVVFVVGGSGR